MLVSFKWLEDYVSLPVTPEELAEKNYEKRDRSGRDSPQGPGFRSSGRRTGVKM
jgi:hypothetical protein